MGVRQDKNEYRTAEYRMSKLKNPGKGNFDIQSSEFDIRYSLLIGAEGGGNRLVPKLSCLKLISEVLI